MKGSFHSIIQQQNTNINSDISILSVLQKCGIELKQNGSRYSALCPLHGDKETPSLIVYPDTNSWTCFGASCTNPNNPSKRNGGRVIDFVMQYYHLNYHDAYKWIVKNFSLSIRKKEQVKFKRPKQLSKIADNTVSYYHSLLNLTHNRDWFIQERGFTNKTIDEQALGYDGENHIIPVWAGEPRISNCLCIKLRRHDDKGRKYIRFGSYVPVLYNSYPIRHKHTIYLFAGELDALLAYQDGLNACSVINGAKSISELGDNWPNRFFPDATKLIIIFDRKEELAASFVASQWDKWKGKFTSHIFQWPFFGGSDYTDYRIRFGHSFQEFKTLL